MLAEKHNDPNSIPKLEQFCSDMNEVSSTKASLTFIIMLPLLFAAFIEREKKVQLCLLHPCHCTQLMRTVHRGPVKTVAYYRLCLLEAK